MGALTGPLAPDPPHNSDFLQFPTGRRTELQRVVSRLSARGMTLATHSTAIRGAMQAMGVLMLPWKKTGVANQIRAWVPGGTLVDWGDAGTDTPSTDGFLNHTYAAPGVYNVTLTNATWKAQGLAQVQV